MADPIAYQDLLTIQQVAKRLAVSVRTVRRWVRISRLPPPIRFSTTCIRWRGCDLDDYLHAAARFAVARALTH